MLFSFNLHSILFKNRHNKTYRAGRGVSINVGGCQLALDIFCKLCLSNWNSCTFKKTFLKSHTTRSESFMFSYVLPVPPCVNVFILKKAVLEKLFFSLVNNLKSVSTLMSEDIGFSSQKIIIKTKQTFTHAQRFQIHTLHQMVSIGWGMQAEKCLCLTGIPWRLSLRCGMLFLSWDSRVLAWLPEGWSSARQIFLPSVFGCHGSQLLQAQNRGW